MIDDIPDRFLSKWRRLLNLTAEIFDVPTALIMRLTPSDLEVIVSSQGRENPYKEKERAHNNAGHYCETVLATRRELQVIDALEDPAWSVNPDLRLGMIHYLGLPLIWPDGRTFGTLCVLDRKPRDHASVSRRLLQHFKEQIETDFQLIEYEQGLLESNDQLGLLVDERTIELRAEMAERERLESTLQHVRKMDALAQMAGGVAHDLNNILSGIVSYPDLLLTQIELDNPLRNALQTIRDSGARAAKVVQDLLAVTRPIATIREPVDVNEAISAYLASPEGLSLLADNPQVFVELVLEPQLPIIGSTPVDITKCVMNLVINAMDAMPSGGSLRIATRLERAAGVKQPLLKSADYVALTVDDSGSGINTDEQQRIFEPYYSTKKLGRSGTGLGLTTVWNIVEESGGRVFVDSSPNGTVFELFFPITDEASLQPLGQTVLPGNPRGSELILVVDDEYRQRDIVSAMLEALGYRTATASSGEEALQMIRKEAYSLIVLDMAMQPGLNGRETYERILGISPDQKAIISTGLLESDEVHQLNDLGISSILAKPYTLAELARAVGDSLTSETSINAAKEALA